MRRSTMFGWLSSIILPAAVAITACSPGLDQAASERSGGTTTTAAAVEDDITADTFPPARPSGRSGDDAADANDAVPSGIDLEFEADNFDLEDDGEHTASLVVPVGWESKSFIGVDFEPNDDELGFFTEMSVAAGCDGLCEVTDWEERLNGPDGYLTMLGDGGSVVERREVDGSEGVLLITQDSFGTSVIVLRWDDSADRYFECEATLDDDAEDLAAAFEAACLAARPDWFPVG